MTTPDYHLFEFNAGGKRYAVPDPEWDMGRETYAARNDSVRQDGVISGVGPGRHDQAALGVI